MVIEFFTVFFMAIIIDLVLGELPTVIHPVVLMGKFIDIIRNNFLTRSNTKNRILGIFMTISLILIFSCLFIVLLYFSKFNSLIFLLLASILLSTTFAIKTLLKSVYGVYESLKKDLNHGRKAVSLLVSRNTEDLTLSEVVSAAIETLTENITDSVLAPLFYIFIFGFIIMFCMFLSNYSNLTTIFTLTQLPIVIAVIAGVSYRVVNTLDAMVGYKDDVNIDMGWFSAKTDDYLNYIPARLTGILIVFSSIFVRYNYKKSWKVMFRDAHNTPSPNSGYPMAAAAGALNVKLEKPGVYTLGEKNEDEINEKLTPAKIIESLKLAIVTISLFLLIIITLMGFFFYFTGLIK